MFERWRACWATPSPVLRWTSTAMPLTKTSASPGRNSAQRWGCEKSRACVAGKRPVSRGMRRRRGTTPWKETPPQTANLGRTWRSRKSTKRHTCEIILNMIWFVTHYVTNQNPYKKTAMQKHSGLFVVRPTGFEPAAFRVGAERSIQLSYGRTSMKTVRRRVSAIQL